MFTVMRGVNFHFFRFEILSPKIAWRVACDVGVGCHFWQREKNCGTFKEEEKYRGISIMVSVLLCCGELGPARAAGVKGFCYPLSLCSLSMYIIGSYVAYVCKYLRYIETLAK